VNDSERNDLQRQLDRVGAARANQNIVTWTVFSVFIAAMGVFANTVVKAFNDHMYFEAAIISFTAMLLAIVWATTLNRSLLHLKLQEDVTGHIEKALELPSEFSVTTRNSLYRERGMETRGGAKVTLQWTSHSSIVVWFVLTMVFLVLSMRVSP
jgi:hypothetical protein